MLCKVTFLVICMFAINEALITRPSSSKSFVHVDNSFHRDITIEDEEEDSTDGISYIAPDEGYGINGGDQKGWAPPADTTVSEGINKQNTSNDVGFGTSNTDQTSAFTRIMRNTNPTTVLGVPIKFPSEDPTCKTGLPSADYKVCCSAACWTCGADDMCNGDPKTYYAIKGQNASLCCTGAVQSSGDKCDHGKPPCLLSKKSTEQLQGPLTNWKHERNEARIKMYLFRDVLFSEAKIDFDKAVDIASVVWRDAHFKVLSAWRRLSVYKKKIADAKKNKVLGSQMAEVYIWADGVGSAKEEAHFYGEIRRNAIWVHQNATEGLNTVDELKYAITGDVEKIDKYEIHVTSLHNESAEAKRQADLLWKQWEDSFKSYDCSLQPVTNAASQCESVHTAQRKCPVTCAAGYDGSHSRNGLRCLKKGAFGKELFGELYGMAVCPARSCGKPPAVGQATALAQDVLFPYAAHYTCEEGHSLDGSGDGERMFQLECGAKGTFPVHDFGCKPIKCGEAPVVEFAHTHKMAFFYTDVAPYKCIEGYTTDGTAGGWEEFETSCLASGAFSVTPSCYPVSCGDSPQFSHTKMVTQASGDQHFPVELEYSCEAGYSLDQNATGPKAFTLKCYPSGEFSLKGQPGQQLAATQCRPVSAGMAPEVAHSSSVPRVMFYGDGELILADSGYSLEGLPDKGFAFILEANEQGAYSGLEAFQPVQCGKAPVVPNGKTPDAKKKVLDNSRFGDVIDYSCDNGYSADATPIPESASFSVKCEADGSFSKIPGQGKCANIDDCADHTCGPHGACVDKLLNYTCVCESGFQEVNDEKLGERICGNIDDCGPEACGVGKCIDLTNDYKCKCPSGYFQQTDGEEHTCVPVSCGNAPEVVNASTQPLEAQFYKSVFEDVVLYQCATGYTLDGTVTGEHGFQIDCGADKSFSPVKSCKPLSCGSVPEVASASKSIASAVYGENVTYTCKTGYSTDGTSQGGKVFSTQCLASSAFSVAQACTRILCGEPESVAHSQRPSGNKRYGDVVKYSCLPGFTLKGKSSVLLSSRVKATTEAVPGTAQCSEWETDTTMYNCETVPKCCMGFEAKGISTDTVQCVEKSYGDDYAVMCPKASETEAETFETKCQKNGKFTVSKQCLPKACGDAPAKINAPHANIEDADVHYPNAAMVTCLDGHTIGGDPKGKQDFAVKCGADGLFERKINQTVCEPVQCGPLPTMKNADRTKLLGPDTKPSSSKTLAFGFKAYYKCQTGYTVGGEPDAGSAIYAECSDQGAYSLPSDDMQCMNVNDCAGHTCGAHGTCVDQVGPAPAYTCKCEKGFKMTTTSDGEKICGNVDDCGGKSCGAGVCKDLIADYTCICPDGYYLANEKGAKTCLPVQCAELPPQLSNGTLLSKVQGAVEYPQSLQYKCSPGYSTDGSASGAKQKFKVHCGAAGRMSGMSGCQKVSCGLPKVFRLTQSAGSRKMLYQDSVVYKCNPGHTIGGTPGTLQIPAQTSFPVKCEASGQQSSPKVCTPVKCGGAPSAGKATVSSAGVLSYGMSVRYTCIKGYTLTGRAHGTSSFTRTCTASGGFTSSGGACKPVSAGRLPTIANAVLKVYNGRPSSGTVVAYYPAGFMYQCKPGYSLTGRSGGATSVTAHVNSMGSIVPSLPSACTRISYTVQGQVKDARTGQSLAGTTVTIVGTGQTANAGNGFFTFSNVPGGNVKLSYAKNGFITGQQQFGLTADVNNGGSADNNLSPRMASDQWRATIKWDAQPRDLDTYVKWGSSKTFYGGRYRSAAGLTAKLEKDDTNGYGPETVYMTGVGRCTGSAYSCDMKYMINDYSRTKKMPNYNAEVTLYSGDKIAGTWKLSDCAGSISGDKNWWHVFTIDGKTNRLKWHCGQNGNGGLYLLHSAGPANSTAEVDYESYVGPFPGRYFRHSQHKQKALPVPQQEETFRFPSAKKIMTPRLRAGSKFIIR